VYHGARFYNPILGRFLSVDPLYGDPGTVEAAKLDEFLSNPQRLSLYSYVLNNPLRYTDPNGLEERTRHPTFLLSQEEAHAWGNELMPEASERWFIPPVGQSLVKFESDQPGSSNALPPAGSGWRRVTVVLRITGPDGKPVAGQHMRVDFSRPSKFGTWGERGQSSTWGVTDKKGFLTVRANVPPRGGQVDVSGFFNDKGTVRPITTGNKSYDPRFTRVSGQSELRFDVNLKAAKATSTEPQGASVEIKQTK
jgi:RHS repeat-associated protein